MLRFGLADVLHAASGYDLTAMHTGARAYIHDIIRAAHGVFIVLHHDDRIAEVAQIFQRSNELVVIALMQADGLGSSST